MVHSVDLDARARFRDHVTSLMPIPMEEGLRQGVPERLAARRERPAGQLRQPKNCKILVGTSAPSHWCQL
jgi:hypothetical protein